RDGFSGGAEPDDLLLRPLLFAPPARGNVGCRPPVHSILREQHGEAAPALPRRHDVYADRYRSVGCAPWRAHELWFLDGRTPERGAVGRGHDRVLDPARAG